MPNTTAAVEALLARMRAKTGGSIAAFLDLDQQPLAVDAARGVIETPRWSAILREVAARWALWCELERVDAIAVDGALVLALWIAPHGVALIDIDTASSIGLARLGVRPLVDDLQRVLDEGAPDDDGDDDDDDDSGSSYH